MTTPARLHGRRRPRRRSRADLLRRRRAVALRRRVPRRCRPPPAGRAGRGRADAATTRSPATGSPSPRTGSTAPSCRRPTSARCAPPAAAPCPPRSPPPTTTSWCSRTASPRSRPWPAHRRRAAGDPIAGRPPAHGRCEVVCFTSDHEAAFASLTAARARTVIDAWADRTAELSAIDEVEQVFCFENRGQEIGVTLHHPHGQIYAYPYVAAPHPAAAGAGPRAPRAHRTAARRRHPGAERATARASSCRASTGPPTCRTPRAGRSRCTSPRTATCPTWSRSRTRSATSWPRSTSTCCAGSTATTSTAYPIALPYIAGWHQAPVREGRDVPGCTCS